MLEVLKILLLLRSLFLQVDAISCDRKFVLPLLMLVMLWLSCDFIGACRFLFENSFGIIGYEGGGTLKKSLEGTNEDVIFDV